LYVVCGQAQRSINFREKLDLLIEHMLNRNSRRTKKVSVPRFEKGNEKELLKIKKMLKLKKAILKIAIVQPGVSKALVSDEQLKLLGITEGYLKETYNIALEVIVSI